MASTGLFTGVEINPFNSRSHGGFDGENTLFESWSTLAGHYAIRGQHSGISRIDIRGADLEFADGTNRTQGAANFSTNISGSFGWKYLDLPPGLKGITNFEFRMLWVPSAATTADYGVRWIIRMNPVFPDQKSNDISLRTQAGFNSSSTAGTGVRYDNFSLSLNISTTANGAYPWAFYLLRNHAHAADTLPVPATFYTGFLFALSTS